MKMSDAEPIRCQKCRKPLGYVTIQSKGLLGLPQVLQNVKLIAICVECHQKKE